MRADDLRVEVDHDEIPESGGNAGAEDHAAWAARQAAAGETAIGHLNNALQIVQLLRADDDRDVIARALAAVDRRAAAAEPLLGRPSWDLFEVRHLCAIALADRGLSLIAVGLIGSCLRAAIADVSAEVAKCRA